MNILCATSVILVFLYFTMKPAQKPLMGQCLCLYLKAPISLKVAISTFKKYKVVPFEKVLPQ